MQAHSAKQDAIEAIPRPPDSAPLDESVYRLYVLSNVQQGIKDVQAGRTISTEELAREIEAW